MTDSSITEKILVDTNLFIYAADPAAGDKNARAVGIIQGLMARNQLVVSAQVLNEFYHASTRPHKPPSLSHDDAAQTIRDLANSVPVFPLTSTVTLRALDAISVHGLSFWDALIWAAAKENGIALVYTEDFQHGRDIEGVRIVNPFLGSPSGPSA
jgi:predicted nucleic acid-binding protein